LEHSVLFNGERFLFTKCSLCQTCINVRAKDALKLSFGSDLGGKDLLNERNSTGGTGEHLAAVAC
jgi:hypothetical protein